MNWQKLGNIFCPRNLHPWMQSHAANPVAEAVDGDLFRIYFSTRDSDNRSSIGYFIIDITRPAEILDLASQPVVSPGPAGTFDDSGASMGCIVNTGSERRLYYLGWNLGVTVPWRNSIGLAVSSEGRPFSKHSPAPVLDRNLVDPFSISYPYILTENGRWRMWYGSNLAWGVRQADMAHVLKYAESQDGIHWRPTGDIAIAFKDVGEYAISRPMVIREGDTYRMWYSYRGSAYRIGYAESENGIQFERMDDKAGITVSASGWDSESIEYPHIFEHRGVKYLLYNGNRYGLTGIGLAVETA